MNVIFLSISTMSHISEPSISLDLLRKIAENGHNVYAVCANDEGHKHTELSRECGVTVLRVKTGKHKKANPIRKGITTVSLPYIYIQAIKKYFSEVKFDLILYPTPPITHYQTVRFLKKRDGACSYLLLKDIFPQNAVDIGMMSNKGPKGVIYRYFRTIEQHLYDISDYIGCMSPANKEYLLQHNKIDPSKIEVCPNAIEITDKSVSNETRKLLREKYEIPHDKIVYVYGGNLGRPQGIPFLIKCLKSQKDNDKVFFLIVGDGTEYSKIEKYVRESDQGNVRLMKRLPREEYDSMVGACDVGMIFLDYRFTIPNFPSRLLAYLQAKLPVLAVTDRNTDIGKIIVENEIGWWCPSNSVRKFDAAVNGIMETELKETGCRGYKFLCENYTVDVAYDTIMQHFV